MHIINNQERGKQLSIHNSLKTKITEHGSWGKCLQETTKTNSDSKAYWIGLEL